MGEYELGGKVKKQTPRFLDLIKGSIKQIELYVKQINNIAWGRLISFPPPEEKPSNEEIEWYERQRDLDCQVEEIRKRYLRKKLINDGQI